MSGQSSYLAEFTHAVTTIIGDSRLTDGALHQQAQEYLSVFKIGSKTFSGSIYNRPKWVERTTTGSGLFSMSALFDAMYLTADELGLHKGKRYVSAAVCACAQKVSDDSDDGIGRHPGRLSEDQLHVLATELSRLGSIWLAFMLAPCESCSCR